MSNFLAVATVTAALRRTLQAVVSQDVSGASVTSVHPSSPQGVVPPVGVNIFLYQIAPNPDWRNRDLPTRRADGSLLQLPEAAIDLFYLFSFYGDDAQLESHRLLGSVTRTLHAQPILDRQTIEDTVTDPAFGYLAASDLADQIEKVRFVPLGALEELAQLWTGIFHQTQYQLSVAYRASVVLLTAEAERPKPALPVRRRQLAVFPLRAPQVFQVVHGTDPALPIQIGSPVEVKGRRLRGARTMVRLAGQDFQPADAEVADTSIRFTLDGSRLDPELLRAGVQALQVIHPHQIGEPPEERGGAESNPAPLLLAPEILGLQAKGIQDDGTGMAAGDVTLEVAPPVGKRQRVSLILNSVAGALLPQAYSFAAPARSSDAASLDIPVTGVVPGRYLVRIQVDGATSPLEADGDPASPTFEQFSGPRLLLEPR
jgi:hypothetical protein